MTDPLSLSTRCLLVAVLFGCGDDGGVSDPDAGIDGGTDAGQDTSEDTFVGVDAPSDTFSDPVFFDTFDALADVRTDAFDASSEDVGTDAGPVGPATLFTVVSGAQH